MVHIEHSNYRVYVGEPASGWITTTNINVKSLADIKYPHKCFKCGKELFWEELEMANKYKDLPHLIKLWKSKYIQFYCCLCYEIQE